MLFRLALVLFLLCFNSCANLKKSSRNPSSIFTKEFKDLFESIIRSELSNAEETRGRYVIHTIPIEGLGAVTNGQDFDWETPELRAVQEFVEDAVDESIVSVRDFIFERFNKKDRHRIMNACFDTDFRVGGFPSSLYMTIGDICDTEYVDLFNEESDLVEALTSFPIRPLGVRYDGENEVMIYEDRDLLSKVNVITSFLIYNKMLFREVFFNQPKNIRDKFSFNSYTSSESSKVEPFDLIHQSLTKRVNASFFGYYREIKKPVNFIELSKLVKKALLQALLVSNQKDIFGWQAPTVSIKKGLESFIGLCANGVFAVSDRLKASDPFTVNIKLEKQMTDQKTYEPYFENKLGSGHIIEKWVLDSYLIDLLKREKLNFDFRCGIDRYDLSIKKLETVSIPKPGTLNLPAQTNVMMTIALSQEVGSDERSLIKKYLNFLEGWNIAQDYSVVDTKNKFEELFLNTDIYLPVSHTMDVNSFLVGTEKSQYLVLNKTFSKNGISRDVNLHLLLPSDGHKYTKTLNYDVEGLAHLYSRRRANNKPSLFLMNISCGSEGTLGTWTFVYRKSVEIDIKNGSVLSLKDYKDLPFIIGSERAFSTESTAALAQHINFPLETIKILAEGGTPEDAVEFLKTPNSKDFVDQLAKMLKSFNSSPSESDGNSFEPVYNLKVPEMMSYGGFEIKLKDRKTGKVQTY